MKNLKQFLALVLSLSLTLAVPARAQEKTAKGELQVANHSSASNSANGFGDAALEAVTKQLTKNLVQGFIDQYIASEALNSATGAVNEALSAGEQTPGTTVVFLVQLGLSIDQFFKTDSDKGKVYAAVDAVVAVVTYINAAVGMIVGVVVMVIKMIDGGISAHQARQIMKIYTNIAIQVRKTKIIATALVKAEEVRFLALFKQMEQTQSRIDLGQKFLADYCSTTDMITTTARMDICLKSTIQVYAQARRMQGLLSELVNAQTSYLQIDMILEKMGTSVAEFQLEIDKFNAAVAEMKIGVEGAIAKYSQATAAILALEAASGAARPAAEEFKNRCLTSATYLTLKTIKALNEDAGKIDSLIEETAEFMLQGCDTNSSGNKDLDGIYDRQHQSLIQAYTLAKLKVAQ